MKRGAYKALAPHQGATKMTTLNELITLPRVPWARMTDAEISAIAHEAGCYGDTELRRRALRALARRR